MRSLLDNCEVKLFSRFWAAESELKSDKLKVKTSLMSNVIKTCLPHLTMDSQEC